MTFSINNVSQPNILLGTALWGWGISESDAHKILDAYVSNGGCWIDAAANYPINRQAEDFGVSSRILSRWLKVNGAKLKVFHKIGGVNNLGSPDSALGPASIALSTELAYGYFAESLQYIAVHWDNRDDTQEVQATLKALSDLKKEGLGIGFSGVKNPDIYARLAPDLADSWTIQVKENIDNNQTRIRYQLHFPNGRYIAYGINMGGVKREQPKGDSSVSLRNITRPPIVDRLCSIIDLPGVLTPHPQTLNELALMWTWANPNLSGVILGPRNVEQLTQSLAFIKGSTMKLRLWSYGILCRP